MDINEKLEKYGANILIVPKTENLSLTYGEFSLGGVSFDMSEIREKDLDSIKSIKNAGNVAATGPIVLGVIKIKNRRVMIAGMDFKVTRILKPWWKVAGELPGDKGILLGNKAAELLKLKLNDRINVKGKDFTVTGIIKSTGSQDDQLVFAGIKTVQNLMGKEGRISMAEIAALCTACPIEDMVNQISEAMPGAKVMAIQQVVKGRMETLGQFKKFSYGVSGVILFIGSLVVLVTMMGSVRERTDEIGIFRAIGFRKSHVMKIILMEAGLISALSGLFGYLLGLGAARVALKYFSENKTASLVFNPELAIGAFILALVIGLLSSLYPAIAAARLDPNDALRSL